MAKKYIEREAAKRAFFSGHEFIYYGADVYERLNDIPAADVVPVRHGQWIWDDEGYHCTECFYHAYGETGEVLSGNWNYCPNCGARMDGDGDV